MFLVLKFNLSLIFSLVDIGGEISGMPSVSHS